MDLARLAGAPAAAMVKLEERIDLDPGLRELVALRASLINGCAYCIDMHWIDVRAAGETEQRLSRFKMLLTLICLTCGFTTLLTARYDRQPTDRSSCRRRRQ
jgi:AhpD family alkylhydroperoxidase